MHADAEGEPVAAPAPRMRWRSLLHLGPLVAASALASLAAGCGGPSPEERFAEEACATILVRAQEMLDLQDDVVHIRAVPGDEARPQMLSFAAAGWDIATRLRSEIRELSAPDSDAGRNAVDYLEDLSRIASEKMVGARNDVLRLPEEVTLVQSIRGLLRLELLLGVAFSDMTSGPDLVAREIPELKEPFEKADSCRSLEELETE